MDKAPTLSQAAWASAKRTLAVVGAFSLFINVLMLTAPLFMLQVYDRVLVSQSQSTLFLLAVVAVGALILYGILDSIRGNILLRVGARFDAMLAQPAFRTVLERGSTAGPLRDIDQLRAFFSSPALTAVFDAPWSPLYLIIGYMLHPWLGHVGLVGGIILFALGLLNQRAAAQPTREASRHMGAASSFAEQSARNRDAIHAMGMIPALTAIWKQSHDQGVGFQAQAGGRGAVIASSAKTIRFIIQVMVLAVGAGLAIQQEITPGVMIAASIILARALAPVEQSIQGWRALVQARQSAARVEDFLADVTEREPTTPLPPPEGRLEVSGLYVVPPNAQNAVVHNVSFAIEPGTILGITGPSGSGKSSLLRALAGIWQPRAGVVRLDGVNLHEWPREECGQYVGYLPQAVELFNATVAQNIARFQMTEDGIVEAAQAAHAHDLILKLPGGYDAPVGASGEQISGGQRQRVALARALFGNPRFILLDEPAANLDQAGEDALRKTLAGLKSRGASVLIVAHQPALFSVTDQLMVMTDGQITAMGPTADILRQITRRVEPEEARKQTDKPASAQVALKAAGGGKPAPRPKKSAVQIKPVAGKPPKPKS